ncbi:MAG: tRNA 2-thiouridine(34) synthase MnmA [candidate division WOR-3 bacterium]
MASSVVVLMSGGVDSTVAALVLKEKGYEVIGVTFNFNSRCGNVQDIDDARKMAKKIGIRHEVIDLADYFRREIIQYFLDEYRNGRTPNPCALCNRRVKLHWGVKVADEFGCEFVATGHYARVTHEEGDVHLKKALWEDKSQEYYLALIEKEHLRRLALPLGEMSKDEVRKRAKEFGLEVHDKEESQDVCFVGKDYRSFLLKRGFERREGLIVDEKGNVLGKHDGYYFFTIGQRRGIGVAVGERLYVKEIIPDKNIVVVAPLEKLYRDSFFVQNVNFLEGLREGEILEVRVRYRGKTAECTLHPYAENVYKVELRSELFAITPGQVAVFYRGDTVVGGGIISG